MVLHYLQFFKVILGHFSHYPGAFSRFFQINPAAFLPLSWEIIGDFSQSCFVFFVTWSLMLAWRLQRSQLAVFFFEQRLKKWLHVSLFYSVLV